MRVNPAAVRGRGGVCMFRLIACLCLLSLAARAELPSLIRIGVLSDMSGSTSDSAGQGSVVAARLAAEDIGNKIGTSRIEIVEGNFQGKPDLALSIARRWFDTEEVYAVVDLPFSNVALAVSDLGAQRDRAIMVASGVASDLTGAKCNAVTTHWTDDSFALANGTARTITRSGRKTWFFLTSDYAFGTAMQRDATQAVLAEGGTVIGAARHPPQGPDMSSFVTQAMASKADVVGLANVGGDTVNSIKEAASFGLVQGGQSLAGLLVFINDVHALGLKTAHGLMVTTGFYWDASDTTRAFAGRFRAQMGRPPSKAQAAVYAATKHWLAAVASSGAVGGAAVTAAMKAMPAEYFGAVAPIRADGRVLYDLTLYQVKTPAESSGTWDYYKSVAVLKAGEAFRSVADGGCALVKPGG